MFQGKINPEKSVSQFKLIKKKRENFVYPTSGMTPICEHLIPVASLIAADSLLSSTPRVAAFFPACTTI